MTVLKQDFFMQMSFAIIFLELSAIYGNLVFNSGFAYVIKHEILVSVIRINSSIKACARYRAHPEIYRQGR